MLTWDVGCRQCSSRQHAAGLEAMMRSSVCKIPPFSSRWASAAHCSHTPLAVLPDSRCKALLSENR